MSKNSVLTSYDRSIEKFLYDSIAHTFPNLNLYPKDVEEAALDDINSTVFLPGGDNLVKHVYGSLSPLPCQIGQYGLVYGNFRGVWRWQDGNEPIRTIHQDRHGRGSGSENYAIQQTIRDAEVIVFLGFAFAPENLNILGIPRVLHDDQTIYGTAFGMTDGELALIKQSFSTSRKTFPESQLLLRKCGCEALLREFPEILV